MPSKPVAPVSAAELARWSGTSTYTRYPSLRAAVTCEERLSFQENTNSFKPSSFAGGNAALVQCRNTSLQAGVATKIKTHTRILSLISMDFRQNREEPISLCETESPDRQSLFPLAHSVKSKS